MHFGHPPFESWPKAWLEKNIFPSVDEEGKFVEKLFRLYWEVRSLAFVLFVLLFGQGNFNFYIGKVRKLMSVADLCRDTMYM